MIIPRTEFTCDTFGCGHPKWANNITGTGHCRHCRQVRNLNENARRMEGRRARGYSTIGERVLREP